MATDALQPPASSEIPVALLDFDDKNPRFPPEARKADDQTLIEKFVRDERLLEIIESIGGQGFFPGEPLLVVKQGRRYKVVEGNRRLAALKLLNGVLKAPYGRHSIENAVESAVFRPEKVHCLIFPQEEKILKYLGFRHITGIKSWSALQKARYMDRLLSISHGDKPSGQALKFLSRETGSTASYLGQSITALRLYDQAEKNDFYGLKISPDDVEFSLLTTALSYSNIVSYLGLSSRADIDVNEFNDEAIGNVFKWLFVVNESGSPIVKESRMLKQLAAVVGEPSAIKELNRSGNLAESYELSKGPSVALADSLRIIERRLENLISILGKIKRTDDVHVDAAEKIVVVAQDAFDLIKRRNSPQVIRRSRSTST